MNHLSNVCELCNREGVSLTKHHLIPKEEGGKDSDLAYICVPCHKTIHSFYTNKELALRLNTIISLKEDPKIKKYLKWIKKQPLKSSIKIRKPRNRNKRR